MADIRAFPGPIDTQALIQMAQDWELDEVVIIGLDRDGYLVWGSSSDKIRDILYLIEKAKFSLDL